MEMSVGFADKDESYYLEQGLACEKTSIGSCYYPSKGVLISSDIEIIYEEKPWLSAFRIEGIKPSVPVRRGPGRKKAKDFVPDLLELIPEAIELMRATYEDEEMEFGMDKYYLAVAESFIQLGIGSRGQRRGSAERKLVAMYYGFVENLWRDGDIKVEEMLRNSLIPKLAGSEVRNDFLKVISKDFNAWIARGCKDYEK